jgi:hypothetical protein
LINAASTGEQRRLKPTIDDDPCPEVAISSPRMRATGSLEPASVTPYQSKTHCLAKLTSAPPDRARRDDSRRCDGQASRLGSPLSLPCPLFGFIDTALSRGVAIARVEKHRGTMRAIVVTAADSACRNGTSTIWCKCLIWLWWAHQGSNLGPSIKRRMICLEKSTSIPTNVSSNLH